MIHHSYDEYEASRSSHYPRGPQSHRGLPSPPSFYAVAPPPPPPAPAPTTNADHHRHSHHHHPSHQSSPHHQANNYYPSAPHPYMTHYPPPPPPPRMAHMDHHDRPGPHSKQQEAEYTDHAPFSPFDYQRHYTYSHNPLPPPGYNHANYGPPGMDGSRFDSIRSNKVNGPRSSISEGHTMSLGDQQPTYVGHIKSANDAILLLSACDLPIKPAQSPDNKSRDGTTFPPPRRVTRRLLDAERADLVASGSVFVWDEKEAGMKRWTDGRVWSASRVSGCFLTYRELEARKKVSTSASSMADGPSTNQYKPDGLIKQSFSITTTSGRKLHVISYFTKRDIREGRLRRVGEDPRFVGEGGGEWGLNVDEKEYSFPDMHQISRAQGGQGGSGGGGESGDGSMIGGNRERGDDESSDLSDLSEHQPSPPRRGNRVVKEEEQGIKGSESEFNRKRSLPEDADDAVSGAATTRPRFTRVRSSSMSGIPQVTTTRESQNDVDPQSYHSTTSTSLATTIPSDSESPAMHSTSSERKPMPYNNHRNLHVATNRSSAIRALVSPTLPRESAIRGSACEMKPTQSQDCANAVGALLSLAGNSNSSTTSGTSHSNSNNKSNNMNKVKRQAAPSPLVTASTPNSPNTTTSSSTSNQQQQQQHGLGLNVQPLPKRRDSDRAALNKFSIRL